MDPHLCHLTLSLKPVQGQFAWIIVASMVMVEVCHCCVIFVCAVSVNVSLNRAAGNECEYVFHGAVSVNASLERAVCVDVSLHGAVNVTASFTVQ